MRRRRFLSLVGLSALAGCSSSDAPTTETPAQTPATTSRETPKSEPTATATAAGVQSQNTEGIRDDLLAVHIRNWAYKDKLRYYDASTDELRFYDRGSNSFYSVWLSVSNLGGNEITDIPDESDFDLISGSNSYTVTEIPPDGSPWSTVRQRPQTPQLNSVGGFYYDKIEPGDTEWTTLHYVAPPDPNWSLEWSPDNGETLRIEPSS